MDEMFVFTDGGARGNPGPAALGVYITNSKGVELAKIGKRIGETTNNVAEYSAVLEALSWLIANKEIVEKYSKVHFFVDSQLIYSQIKGIFKVKSQNLQNYVFSVHEKQKELAVSIEWSHIPREKNTKADAMVNLALDNMI
jgi:ribonuclease HI